MIPTKKPIKDKGHTEHSSSSSHGGAELHFRKESAFLDGLMEGYNYNIRPVKDHEQLMMVHMDLAFHKILEIVIDFLIFIYLFIYLHTTVPILYLSSFTSILNSYVNITQSKKM